MKKTLALALALLMALGCMSITAFAELSGEGTETNPYLFSKLEIGDVVKVNDFIKNDTEHTFNIIVCYISNEDGSTNNLCLQLTSGETTQLKFYKFVDDAQFEYKGFDPDANFGQSAYVFETAPVPTQKSSGAAEITAIIKTAGFEYEMVIPTATTLTEANHENVLLGTDGKVSITNVKNPTDNVSVSYTVDLTDGDLTDGTNTINATYKYKQGDAEFAAIDGTTKVTVYENKTVNDSFVNVTANNDQWDAAPVGTYNATVTFNFETEEKETTCKVTDLIMYRVVKIEDGQDGRVIQLMYLYRDGQFTAPSESCFDSSKTGFESAVGTSDYAVGDCFHMNADYSGYTKCVNPDSHGINSDNVIISISRSDIQEGTKLYFAEPVGITYAVKDGALYFPADKESSWTGEYAWTLNGVPLSNGDTGTLQDGDAFIGTKISN